MNREIKFRGKDYEYKWRYGDLVQEKWGQGKAIMIKKNTTAWSVLEDTVGQFTGLKDENGKEIYEGDIIEFSYDEFIGNFDTKVAKGTIEFTNGTFIIKTFEIEGKRVKDTDYEEWFLLYTVNTGTLKVIGNVHENLELLEGVKIYEC